MKNPLIISLKGELQKPFDFISRCQTVFGLLTCWLKYLLVLSCRGIGQFNCDDRSQQHVEAIYRSFDFIGVLHVPPEKHRTENGVIAGSLWSDQMILETKQVLFMHIWIHSIHSRSRNAYDSLG